MNDAVRPWLEKAESDFTAAQRVLDIPDTACFHCQQCVEKLIKGCLIARGVDPPKIHDLALLHRLLRANEPQWDWSEDELNRLSAGAVIFRYPGEDATEEEAREAFDIMQRLRIALLPLLETTA